MPTFLSRGAAQIAFFAALSLAAVPVREAPPEPAKAAPLTEAQKQTLRSLQADAAAKTAQVLQALPATAKSFNANLLSEAPDPEIDRKLGQKMADAFAEIIQLRLARIRNSAKVLTREQRLALEAELQKPDSAYLFDDLLQKVLGDPGK